MDDIEAIKQILIDDGQNIEGLDDECILRLYNDTWYGRRLQLRLEFKKLWKEIKGTEVKHSILIQKEDDSFIFKIKSRTLVGFYSKLLFYIFRNYLGMKRYKRIEIIREA